MLFESLDIVTRIWGEGTWNQNFVRDRAEFSSSPVQRPNQSHIKWESRAHFVGAKWLEREAGYSFSIITEFKYV
jgi:hypothetical protein